MENSNSRNAKSGDDPAAMTCSSGIVHGNSAAMPARADTPEFHREITASCRASRSGPATHQVQPAPASDPTGNRDCANPARAPDPPSPPSRNAPPPSAPPDRSSRPESDSTVGAAASSSETTTALNLAIPPKQPAQPSSWQRWHGSTMARNILRQNFKFSGCPLS
jgi:hypothetical protein